MGSEGRGIFFLRGAEERGFGSLKHLVPFWSSHLFYFAAPHLFAFHIVTGGDPHPQLLLLNGQAERKQPGLKGECWLWQGGARSEQLLGWVILEKGRGEVGVVCLCLCFTCFGLVWLEFLSVFVGEESGFCETTESTHDFGV